MFITSVSSLQKICSAKKNCKKLISSMNLNLENYHISQTLFARFACTPKVALQRGRPRWKESRTEPYLKLTSSLSSPAHTRSD